MKSLLIKFNLTKEIIKKRINNNKGSSVITNLLWAAIIVLAVIALQSVVNTAFSAFGGSFATWLANKAIQIFQ